MYCCPVKEFMTGGFVTYCKQNGTELQFTNLVNFGKTVSTKVIR